MVDVIELLIRGLQDQRCGRLAEAVRNYELVPSSASLYPRALTYRGLAALAAGDPTRAAALLDQAASLRPDHVETRLAQARSLLGCGRAMDARAAAARAIEAAPMAAEAWFLAGTAARSCGDGAGAVEALGRAIELAPNHASAHLNLANALADLDRLEEAETLMRRAAALDPALPEIHASLGWLLTGAGRLEEAKHACRQAIALRPDFARAHWNLSFACLLAGEFEEGWREYEWRKAHDRFAHDFLALPGPEWQGEPLAGRAILVQAEQGLGDTIQLARFLPMLAARGATVILVCAATLVPLLREAAGVSRVVARGEAPGPYDVWVDQMSLPRLLGIRLETIPGALGYLEPDPVLAAGWVPRMPPGLRVGLVWAGNPRHGNDRRRSLPIGALAPVLKSAEVNFVSLQVGPRSREFTDSHGIADRSAELSDFSRTAALISELDLVIAVDTSTAHLAGSLGVPVWVLLPYAADWRWMTGRRDTPWYRSMRLFRQERPGDWSAPIAAVVDRLGAGRSGRLKRAWLTRPLGTGQARSPRLVDQGEELLVS